MLSPLGSDMDSLRYKIKAAVAEDLLSGRLALSSEEKMFNAVKYGQVGGIEHILSRDTSPVAPEGLLSRTPGNLEDKCRLCALAAPDSGDYSSIVFASLYLGRMRELQKRRPADPLDHLAGLFQRRGSSASGGQSTRFRCRFQRQAEKTRGGPVRGGA